MPQDWGIVFSCPHENLELLKPIMEHVNRHFVVALVRVDDVNSLKERMSEDDGLENIRLEE